MSTHGDATSGITTLAAMTAGNWIAITAIAVPTFLACVGLGSKLMGALGQIQGDVREIRAHLARLDHHEERLDKHDEILSGHGHRITN